MIELPRKRDPRAGRPPLEATVLRGIREAFARLEWVTVWRNNVGGGYNAAGQWFDYGLCEGSADLIGICRVVTVHGSIGRFFALEVKQPGKKPSVSQLAFLDVVRKAGGAATWVDNVTHAVGWIERVHAGEVE